VEKAWPNAVGQRNAGGLEGRRPPLQKHDRGRVEGQFVHGNRRGIPPNRNTVKVKIDPDNLLKINCLQNDKMSYPDEFIKTNDLPEMPMS
jgi:hypothetical protein